MTEGSSEDSRALAERTFREAHGRVLATLIRLLGDDFDAAEEAVADAFVAALETWPRDGLPANPAAWLTTTAHNLPWTACAALDGTPRSWPCSSATWSWEA